MDDEQFKEAVIQFIKEYYRKHKKGPATRKIFEKFRKERNLKKRVRKIFGGVANAYKLAGIPVPEVRIEQTRKALEARKKKRATEASKQASTPLDLQQSYEREKREQAFRKEFAEKRAKEDYILALDPNPEISRPILEAQAKYLPEILKVKYGITATLPEMITLKKAYDKAEEEGWCVDDVIEWGLLSEEEQADFKQLSDEAHEKGLSVHGYIDQLKGEVKDQQGKKGQLLTGIRELEQKKKDLNWNYSILKTQYDNLKNRHDEAEKQLDDAYYQKAKDYAFKFGIVKRQMQDEIGKLINKRERLKTECTLIKKQTASSVQTAKEAVKERDQARSELKQLRALVGPKGTVPDLAKQKDELKAQLKERDHQLAEKAMEVAGKWLNQEEALQIFNEENKRLMGEVEGVCHLVLEKVERRIENAGPALYVLEFLESELPEEKFRELTFAINLAAVKRESLNPGNPYFASLPMMKKELLGAFPTVEEYQRLHKERIERIRKRREAQLEKIRQAANDIATIETWGKIGEQLLDIVVKPAVEAYFNPKKD